MVQPFDLRNLELQGEPRRVADHIERMETGGAVPGTLFSASTNGVLAWRHGGNSPESVLQWLDRTGKRLSVVGEAAAYSNPALSPDERRLAVGIRDPKTKTRDIWIIDLFRGTKTRLTADHLDPICRRTAHGLRSVPIVWDKETFIRCLRTGRAWPGCCWGGKGAQTDVEDWSPDGKYLMYDTQTSPQVPQIHLYVLPLTGDRKHMPFVNTEFVNQ
jgi:hypothetical protein